MTHDIAGLAVLLLRESPRELLPLATLRERFTAMAPHTPGTAELYAAVVQRPDLFVTVAPADDVATTAEWTEAERASYAQALAACGISAEPRIGLTAAAAGEYRPESRPALAHVERSVLDLWENGGADAELRATLTRALTELERMRASLDGPLPVTPP